MTTPSPMMAKQPMAPMAEEEQMPGNAGYTIQIMVAPSGELSVGVDDDMQPAGSIKEALTIAMEIYKADGVMPEPDQSDMQFAEGYENG